MPTLEAGEQIVDIDPFTVFGLFNKKLTDANRILILTAIARLFGITAPVPQSFITLSCGNDVFIIDAKYYSHTTQTQYDVRTLHSNNLYQIFTYVKNKEAELMDAPHKKVAGMLLYARTDEAIQPDHTYSMSGNKISVKTLDLNCEFRKIRAQLDGILASHYGISN